MGRYWEGRCKDTWKRELKLPWRETGPPHHHDNKVDSDQKAVDEKLSLRVGRGTPTEWKFRHLIQQEFPNRCRANWADISQSRPILASAVRQRFLKSDKVPGLRQQVQPARGGGSCVGCPRGGAKVHLRDMCARQTCPGP